MGIFVLCAKVDLESITKLSFVPRFTVVGESQIQIIGFYILGQRLIFSDLYTSELVDDWWVRGFEYQEISSYFKRDLVVKKVEF